MTDDSGGGSIAPMERYFGVRGHRNVDATSRALEASGARILKPPDPTVAPFEYTIATRDGRRLELVCYAFTANKYRQGGRPSDEHRFQVKYGNDFRRYHELFFDRTRARITLMYGIHHEEGIFVAVDPEMHNPTWFSMSVEFKDEDVRQTKSAGWHGWQRERSPGRRKLDMPQLNCRTEAVLGFVPQQFLTYALFEGSGHAQDAGERLRRIDLISEKLSKAPSSALHELERELGLPARDILDVVRGRFRLLAAVRGGVAEHHLGELLADEFGRRNVERFDEDGQPDFAVHVQGRTVRVECKNVLRRFQAGLPHIDFQKTRASKGDPCSRYYSKSQFEVLAACLHPVTSRWEFRFAPTSMLEPHSRCPGRLSPHVRVNDEGWARSLRKLLSQLRP